MCRCTDYPRTKEAEREGPVRTDLSETWASRTGSRVSTERNEERAPRLFTREMSSLLGNGEGDLIYACQLRIRVPLSPSPVYPCEVAILIIRLFRSREIRITRVWLKHVRVQGPWQHRCMSPCRRSGVSQTCPDVACIRGPVRMHMRPGQELALDFSLSLSFLSLVSSFGFS